MLLYFLFLINHQQSLNCLLPNHSPIYPWSAESVLSKFYLASEDADLNPPSKISFPDTVPYSVNEPPKTILNEYPAGWPCSPNPPNVLPPLWSPERFLLPYTTSQRQNGPNYHFYLGLLSAMTLQLLSVKTLLKCFNQVNKLLLWKETILPIIYFIEYSCGGFGKL